MRNSIPFVLIVLVLVIFLSNAAKADPNLLVWYTFDEGTGNTATDSSGNGLDGVISGAVYTMTTADGSASCLDFNGFGDNVLNSAAGPYLNNLSEMSISLWIQSDLTDTDNGFIILGDFGSDRYGMRYDKAGAGGTPNVIKRCRNHRGP